MGSGFSQRTSFFDLHWKPPKLYYFKTIKILLFVHKHGKTYYEDLLDNSTPVSTIFIANEELKLPSRAIIREKTTLCMQKRTIRKSSKPVLYYNNKSAAHRLNIHILNFKSHTKHLSIEQLNTIHGLVV